MYAGRVCCGIAAAGVLDCVLCGRSASMAAAEYGLAWDHSGGVQVLRYRCCGFVGLGNFVRGATTCMCHGGGSPFANQAAQSRTYFISSIASPHYNTYKNQNTL